MFSLRNGFGIGGLLSRTLPVALQPGPEQASPLEPTDDEYWMLLALERAMSAVGRSYPNPTVGCVIVKDGRIIAEGATETYGSRHAERVAIESVADRAQLRGATIYVTLEPCSHTGRQPPCVDLVTSCGFKRCVIGVADPNPLVAGNGLQRVRETGMASHSGILRNEIITWHLPFLFSHLAKRPLVAATWAQTPDGQLVNANGTSKWLPDPRSQAYTHWLRQKYDAVLVSADLMLSDPQTLTVHACREPHHRQPIRLLFDPGARTLSCPEVAWAGLRQYTLAPGAPTVLMVRDSALKALRERLLAHSLEHVHLVPLPEEVSPAAALQAALAGPYLSGRVGQPLQSVMIEGDPHLLSTLAAADMIDVAHVFATSPLAGNPLHLPALHGMGTQLQPVAQARLGEDLLTEYLHAAALRQLEGLEKFSGPSPAPRVATAAGT